MPFVDAAEMRKQHQYADQVRQYLARLDDRTPWRYYIETLGCQLNENDSEKLGGQFSGMGFLEADSADEADVVLLNTCAIRENADDRFFGHLGALKSLRSRRDRRSRPIIGVCGCLPKMPSAVERIRAKFPYVELIFGPQDIHRLPEFMLLRLEGGPRLIDPGEEDWLAEGLPVKRAKRHRALVSIMFGCDNFCSYCVVPHTRGRERSRDRDEILRELRELVEDGCREVMLLGQNVNSYRHGFAELLRQAAQIPDLYRIRFMTSHPKDISAELLRVMAEYPAIERHLHLPLQSGSDGVLERMNRGYTRSRYLQIIEDARRLMPDLALSTDLIVGFPGETEDDFLQTLDLMRQIRFDAAFTFLYSRRPGTPAAEAADQIDPATAQERFERLVDLQNEHALTANQAQLGQIAEVLIDGPCARQPDRLSSRDRYNRLINIPRPDDGQDWSGSIAQVRIVEAKTFSLAGEPIGDPA